MSKPIIRARFIACFTVSQKKWATVELAFWLTPIVIGLDTDTVVLFYFNGEKMLILTILTLFITTILASLTYALQYRDKPFNRNLDSIPFIHRHLLIWVVIWLLLLWVLPLLLAFNELGLLLGSAATVFRVLVFIPISKYFLKMRVSKQLKAALKQEHKDERRIALYECYINPNRFLTAGTWTSQNSGLTDAQKEQIFNEIYKGAKLS